MNMRNLLFLLALVVSSCSVSQRVRTPVVVPPSRDATLSDLVEIVNRRGSIETLTAKVDLRFETREEEESGFQRQYRTAQGRILLARPERIRLQIDAPMLGASIAEMASNGRHFQLLIHPEDYRALIEGTNDRAYAEEAEKLSRHPELEEAGPLAHIRPQHFTEAFLFDPIDPSDPDTHVFMNEERGSELEERPGSREEREVIRSYYVLSVHRRGEGSPRRKFWFDRTRALEITRQQSYDDRGLLVAEVSFGNYLPSTPDLPDSLPVEVRIDRYYEKYSLDLTLYPATLSVNGEIPETAFVLETPPEWSGLRHIDLDQPDEP